MARVKTFVNGGSLLPGDLNSIQDDYEYAFSTYEDMRERQGALDKPGAAGTFVLGGLATTRPDALAPGATTCFSSLAFYLDPADRLANTRVTKYRVRASVYTDATAPAANYTLGLYPVATWGSNASAMPIIATLGAVVTGSTVAVNAPAASSAIQGNSGDFTAPAAGWYCLAVVVSTTPNTSSALIFGAAVQKRSI